MGQLSYIDALHRLRSNKTSYNRSRYVTNWRKHRKNHAFLRAFVQATVCPGEHVFQIANRFSDRRNKKSETLDKRSILPYTKGKKRA